MTESYGGKPRPRGLPPPSADAGGNKRQAAMTELMIE